MKFFFRFQKNVTAVERAKVLRDLRADEAITVHTLAGTKGSDAVYVGEGSSSAAIDRCVRSLEGLPEIASAEKEVSRKPR